MSLKIPQLLFHIFPKLNNSFGIILSILRVYIFLCDPPLLYSKVSPGQVHNVVTSLQLLMHNYVLMHKHTHKLNMHIYTLIYEQDSSEQKERRRKGKRSKHHSAMLCGVGVASGRGCYSLCCALSSSVPEDFSRKTYTKVVQSTMAGELSSERERKCVKRCL